jgi:HlyD family secretion protein
MIMLRRRSKVLPDALPFQRALDDIVDAPAPTALRLTGAIVGGLVIALILTASLNSIDIVVRADGHLAADAPTMMVQPIERSILRAITVKPGDRVAKGQLLATLDPTFSQADRLALITQQRGLRAAILRIDAELSGKLFVGNPADSDIALQSSLYQQHQATFVAHLRALDEDVGRDNADLGVTQADVDLLSRELVTAKSIETIRAALLATQNGSRLNFLDAQAASLHAERDQQAALGKLTDLQHARDAKLAERQGYIGQFRSDLLEELARNRSDLAKIEDALTKAERMHDLMRLIAPEDGIVLEVARRSEGSIIREAEPLIILLPSQVPLIADVRIASADIGYLHQGDAVLLKIDALPFQRHGTVAGHLRAIGEQSVAAESLSGSDAMRNGSETLQRAQITIDGANNGELPDGSRIIPGMTVTAEVNIGARSVMSYFLTPITKGFAESLKEP